jgi:hypothetical protein
MHRKKARWEGGPYRVSIYFGGVRMNEIKSGSIASLPACYGLYIIE